MDGLFRWLRFALRALRRRPTLTASVVLRRGAAHVRHGAALAAGGLLIGLGGALAASRLLATLLYQVSPTDPPTFLIGGTVLGASALLAAALPALRAARLDPAVALRAE